MEFGIWICASKVIKSDWFAYEDGSNLTLQDLQRHLAESLARLSTPTSQRDYWTLQVVLGKGDWKFRREWLEQVRHWSNLPTPSIPNGSGMICPRCLCGADDSKPWLDVTERFDNPADLAIARLTCCLAYQNKVCTLRFFMLGAMSRLIFCLGCTLGVGPRIALHSVPGWDGSMELPDLLHVIWLGTGRDAVASLALDYCEHAPELQDLHTYDERLLALSGSIRSWCRDNGLDPSIIEDMSNSIACTIILRSFCRSIYCF